MSDGAYERRGPREAELARFRRILDELAARRKASDGGGKGGKTEERPSADER